MRYPKVGDTWEYKATGSKYYIVEILDRGTLYYRIYNITDLTRRLISHHFPDNISHYWKLNKQIVRSNKPNWF